MKRALVTSFLAATMLAAPAAAQDEQETPPQVELNSPPATAEDRAVLHAFARCVAGRWPNQAASLNGAYSDNEDYRRSLMRLIDTSRSCLGRGVLRFAPELFVGGMAERLLDREVQSGTLGARVVLDPNGPPISTTDRTEIMSICIVRAVPAEVETLFSTTPGSQEEVTALQAIGPSIAPCLARGAELRVNRPGLRAMLARAAYRLVQHNAAPAAAGN